jgi:hypothetical protein
MDDTTETRLPGAFSASIAGLQAGMLGALWMLAWLGVSAAWQNQGFWNTENLFSTAFYGSGGLRSDLSMKTLPGLALFLLLYSLLGGLFALAMRHQPRSLRLTFTGILFAVAWFYLSFHVIWKSALPLVYLLYSERPMVVAHLIYGVCVGRFPAHFARRPKPPAPMVTPVVTAPLELPPVNDETPESVPPSGQSSLNEPPPGF